MSATYIAEPGKIFVGGTWVAPAGGDMDNVINPATEEILAKAPVGTIADADMAIQAARDAFDHGPWPIMSGRERADKLQHFHDALLSRRDRFVRLLIEEVGSVYLAAEGPQFLMPLANLRFAIKMADQPISTPYRPVVAPHFLGSDVINVNLLEREPVGDDARFRYGRHRSVG